MQVWPVGSRSPGGGHDNPFQYSCPENSMDRGAWWATVHGVKKSQTRPKQLSTRASKSQQWTQLFAESWDLWVLLMNHQNWGWPWGFLTTQGVTKRMLSYRAKSEREEQILHINAYMWNLEKCHRWNYLQSRNWDRDKEPTYRHHGVGGGGDELGDRDWHIHYYVCSSVYVEER